jgi:hypothetical protein
MARVQAFAPKQVEKFIPPCIGTDAGDERHPRAQAGGGDSGIQALAARRDPELGAGNRFFRTRKVAASREEVAPDPADHDGSYKIERLQLGAE